MKGSKKGSALGKHSRKQRNGSVSKHHIKKESSRSGIKSRKVSKSRSGAELSKRKTAAKKKTKDRKALPEDRPASPGEAPAGNASLPSGINKQEKERKKALAKLSGLNQEAGRLKSAEFRALLEKSAGIASADPQDQADWVWQQHAVASGATDLEREGFSGACILPLASPGDVQSALHERMPKEPGAGGRNGSPAALVLAASATAANELVKKLRQPSFGRVAKLFAKHIKLEEQRQFLAENPVRLGVGTPNRIFRLAELEAVCLDNLRLLVIDVQRDAKLRTVLDVPETRLDFSRFFGAFCLKRFQSQGLRLCLVDGSKL